MENVQIILNTESTLCLLYVYMILFIICYLYVLKLYWFKILNIQLFLLLFLICNYFEST